jgi:lysophospholipase L1-like esterase
VDAPVNRYDVVVLSMGANDATGLCTPRRWVQLQNELADVIGQRFAPNLLVHSAVPPMHSCAALPQPLRWFMGRWAREMNRQLVDMLSGQVKRNIHWHPVTTTATGLAMDGMHPNSSGYALWAEELYQHILTTHEEGIAHPA